MGCFTTIIHPIDGRGLQIKCGYDVCETYHVGDNVSWYVDKYWPKSGYLLDDVYDSFDDDWVIIKDHIVAAVVPRSEAWLNGDDGADDRNSLRKQYDIQNLRE